MAKTRMDITAFAGKLLEEDDADALKEDVQVLAQALMEAEVSAQIGALPYERSSERTAYRNGYRTRTWDTQVGTIELKVPKVTAEATSPASSSPAAAPRRPCTPSSPRPTSRGVSTRKLDDLVKALGSDGISRSEVSRICKALDSEVEAFRSRAIEEQCP